MKLKRAFYTNKDAVFLARSLLGKYLVTGMNGEYTSAMITETEAYNGKTDKACHAWGGKVTDRNSVMYSTGGRAYVYLCYGLHHLFNVVTSVKDDPKAVLVRAVRPAEGIDIMKRRRGTGRLTPSLSDGPGKLTKCLGITVEDSGAGLTGKRIYIEDRGVSIPDRNIISSPRVGIDYAGDDAGLPYRFRIRGEIWTG